MYSCILESWKMYSIHFKVLKVGFFLSSNTDKVDSMNDVTLSLKISKVINPLQSFSGKSKKVMFKY